METEQLRIFVEVSRHRSFAAVARELDVTASAVSRAIASLERELGLRLFQRTTRRLSPTEAGAIYFERLAPLVEALDEARHLATDSGEDPSGLLRITAPVTFAQLHLLPLLPPFARRFPKLSFELLLTDAFVDLVAERFDVAIRLGRLEDSSLIAHRLCDMPYAICASPGYLATHSRPRDPQDLSRHDCLRYPVPGYRSVWRFRDRRGRHEEVRVSGRFTVSNGIALRQCAIAGLGITLLPRWNVADAISDGTLVELLTRYEATPSEFEGAAWVIYPSREYLPLKVRAFVDHVRSAFANGVPVPETTRRRRGRGDVF